MRKKERIKPFLEELGKIWEEECPDWRFGQLIFNVFHSKNPFYLEEDKFLAEVKSYFNRYANYNEYEKKYRKQYLKEERAKDPNLLYPDEDEIYEKYFKQRRELEIVDAYCSNLWAILCDYDGYYDPESKKGDLEGLASLVRLAIDYSNKIRDRDDKSIIFSGFNFNDKACKKYNILMEEIKDEDK